MKKLNITFCSYPDYSGNGRAFYEYMQKNYPNLYNYTWIFTDKKSIDKYKNEVNSILIGTDKFNKYIPKTDIFFTTHINLAGDKAKTKNAFYVELGHGIGPKPGGYLMDNLSKKEYDWTNFTSSVIDYTVVPSDFWAVLSSSATGIEHKRCLSIGFPKLDYLVKKDAPARLSKLVGIDVKNFSKILFYLPTFRKGCGRKNKYDSFINLLNLDDYNENDLIKYLEKNNFLLIIKKHPSEETEFNCDLPSKNIIEIKQNDLLSSGYDLNEILPAADLLITDYSSVAVEFSFLEKPIVFISSDLDEYESQRGIIFKNYDFWTNGESVHEYVELIKLFDKYLLHDYKINNNILAKKKLLFSNLKDGGCKNIYNYFFKDGRLQKYLTHNNKSKEIEENKKLRVQNKEQEETIKKLYESKLRLEEIENSRLWKICEKLRGHKKK